MTGWTSDDCCHESMLLSVKPSAGDAACPTRKPVLLCPFLQIKIQGDEAVFISTMINIV